MQIIIVPLSGRLVVEVGIDHEAGSTLIRRIDRSLKGAAALQEVFLPGANGAEEFISRLQANPSGGSFTTDLAWLTAQQS